MAQMQTIGTHKTKIIMKDNILSVKYVDTEVVKATLSHIYLNTNGWKTNTTKTRMNQASNQFDLGFYVYQNNFKWFVEYKGKTYLFNNDSLTLERN